MNYELNKIVRILRTLLLPQHVATQKKPEKYLSAYTTRIINSIDGLDEELHNQAHYLAPGADYRDVRNLIQIRNSFKWIPVMERDSTRALNVLYAIFHTKYADEFDKLPDELAAYYYQLFERLRALLLYIRTAHYDFCERKALVPHFYRVHRMADAEVMIERIERMFAHTDAPMAIVQQMQWCFHLVCVPRRPMRYEDIRDCKGVLLTLAYARSLRRIEKGSIMDVFFVLQIDNSKLRDTYIETVSKLVKQYDTADARLFFFHNQVRMVKQAIMEQDSRYYQDKIDILESLLDWLDTEIAYLEKVRPLNPQPPPPAPHPEGKVPEGSKLRVNMSVHELGLLFLLLAESDFIEKTNFTDLTKRIIPYLKTARVDEVLFDSVRSRVNEYDQKLFEKLEAKVEGLLERVRRGMRR